MGKRKPRRKAPARAAPQKLEEEFDCPFCSSIKSIQVAMRRKDRVASLSCRGCPVSFEMNLTPLDEPVDIYSCWIDSCEEVNMPAQASAARFRPPKRRRQEDSDAELEREAEQEDALDEEAAYTAEEDEEEEAFEDEDDEPAIEIEPPVSKVGRLEKKSAWESDDED